jgi:hypothetical protein
VKIPTPYKCDYCLTKKGETNHWWLRDVAHSSTFLLRVWDDGLADADGVEHICSESCASKALSQYMARIQAAPSVALIGEAKGNSA